MDKPRIIEGVCEFCGIKAEECIHHKQVFNEEKQLPSVDISKDINLAKIPKIIYTTWISDKPIPEKFHKYIESWKKVMPDYEIIIISMDNCPHNAWIDECLRRKMFCVAGHYARVQRVFETGGIYFDIDVEAIKPFDRFLNDKMFVGKEDDVIINNAVFGASAGHPFLKAQMEYLDSFDINSENVELETGIRAFARMFMAQSWGDLITYYPPKFFYPYSWDEEFNPSCIKEDTYAVHHWGYSWNNKVSIIIPCYKQEEYLNEAIDSALNQTVKPLEVIVVNDGLPTWDNWKNNYSNKLVKVINQENKGVSSARNTGIYASRGKYILTLDADDKIEPDFIKKTIGINDVVSTTLKTFGTEERIWDPEMDHPTFKDFIVNNRINCFSLFTREAFDKVGGYDEKMRLGYEDWYLWVRMSHAGFKFTVIREPLFRYRKHGYSMVDQAKEKDSEIRAYMTNKYKNL